MILVNVLNLSRANISRIRVILMDKVHTKRQRLISWRFVNDLSSMAIERRSNFNVSNRPFIISLLAR